MEIDFICNFFPIILQTRKRKPKGSKESNTNSGSRNINNPISSIKMEEGIKLEHSLGESFNYLYLGYTFFVYLDISELRSNIR